MSIETFIAQIAEQDDEAQTSFNAIIMEKLAHKLEEKKREVMSESFNVTPQ